VTEPVPIDYAVDVPTDVIGHCCYWDKCVWTSRVRSIDYTALRLVFRRYFSLEVLRTFGAKASGSKASRAIRRAVFRYAALRRGGLSHEEAFRYVANELAKLLGDTRAVEYVGGAAKRIYESAERIVRENVAAVPPTGWRVLADETYTTDLLFFPSAYMFRVLSFALKLPRTFTNLVFCDDRRCYPAPMGLWPGDSWLQLVGQSLRHDVYYHFLHEFGAASITEYLTNIGTEEIAISIKPGTASAKVSLFVLVDDPAKHAVTVARMQKTAEKVSEQLEKLILYELRQKEGAGREVLGITDDDILRIVEEVLEGEKGKKVFDGY